MSLTAVRDSGVQHGVGVTDRRPTVSRLRGDRLEAGLDTLLADPAGRYSLVQHLADFAVLALDPSLPDDMRGRIVREHFGGRFLTPGDGLKRAADGSIVREDVSGWIR
jgi:hypothetical protein